MTARNITNVTGRLNNIILNVFEELWAREIYFLENSNRDESPEARYLVLSPHPPHLTDSGCKSQICALLCIGDGVNRRHVAISGHTVAQKKYNRALSATKYITVSSPRYIVLVLLHGVVNFGLTTAMVATAHLTSLVWHGVFNSPFRCVHSVLVSVLKPRECSTQVIPQHCCSPFESSNQPQSKHDRLYIFTLSRWFQLMHHQRPWVLQPMVF